MFLTDNLWKIFEVAREERTDGDHFEGDMSAEYKAIVGTDPANREASRYKELSAAFTAGDRDTFERIKAEALAELHGPEGV